MAITVSVHPEAETPGSRPEAMSLISWQGVTRSRAEPSGRQAAWRVLWITASSEAIVAPTLSRRFLRLSANTE